MGIFHRVSDIVSANINDLVDRFEDPEKMLRQAIREMEESIAAAMDGAAKAIATERLLAKDLERSEGESRGWQGKAEEAVEAGDDALARKALRWKLENERRADSLRAELKRAEEANQRLRREIDAMRRKLSEAKRKLVVLSARQRTADARKQMHAQVGGGGTEAFQKFERMEERIEMDEAEADALASLKAQQAAGEAEAEEAARLELAVEAELARLKERKRAGTGRTPD